MLHGILPVWKPKGYTSHDIVGRIRRIVGQKRVGHTGTLDPEVEGVLPVCLGQATRLVEYLQEQPKSYHGKMVLGVATDTEDHTGTLTELAEVVHIDTERVEAVFAGMVGEIEQIPPMYSAVKVAGKRLYQLAREGKVVERKPRKVTIHQLDLLSVELGTHPEIEFIVQCSKGTYIRTLCVDIGRQLGYPAHMSDLQRTGSGCFILEDCFTLEELEQTAKSQDWSEVLYSLDEVLGQFPVLIVENDLVQRIWDGWELMIENYTGKSLLFRVYSEAGEFCALYRLEETGIARAEKVFREVNENGNHSS